MAINKKLISFATQVQFDNQLSAGNIDNRSIVFIEDKKRIWTHGVYFDTLWDYIQNKPSTLDEYGITDAAKKINSLYYVEGNTSGTAGSWTGTIPEITSLYTGLTIAYKIGVAGAGTTNLNINGYGNKIVRRNNTNLTTHLPTSTVVILTYDGTYWVWADYTDGNNYDRTYWGNTITAGAPIYSYKLLMQGLDGKFYPLTLETGTGTTKTISTQEFEINSQILYYATTTTVATNGTATNVYSEYPVTTLSYTANQASWISQQLIYLKGTILPNGNFKLDNTSHTSFMTQTLPTTADGFVYVLLGYMYSTTAMRLFQFHPMYEYRDGALRTYMPMHSHGNITDGGAIGSVANKPIITGTGGVLQVGSFGTSANTFAEGNHTHSYLPLTGGTLTGSSYNILELKRSSANGSSILFSNSSVNLGKIGFIANGGLVIGTGTTTDGVADMLSITSSGVAQFYGNISTSGLVTGTGFSKTGATDAHVLLGNGGHKSISDFNASLVTSTTASGTTNIATFNTNTYLNIVQGGASVGSSTQIVGSNGITVASDATGKLTITGLGAHAGIYSSRANGLGASSNSIEAKDTRNINPLPNTDLQRGVWFDFKTNSAIGLTGASIYSSVITMVPYGDNTGNSNTAFRLAQSENNLYFQNWTTVWGTWNKVWHSGNLANGTTAQYIRGDGSLATYTDTTYSLMTAAEAITGTATTARTISAKVLADEITRRGNTLYLPLTGGTLTGTVTAPKILINKAGNVASGISWYNSTYTAWQDYMANSGTTGNGINANITAPSGSLVTTWARRSFIENTTGYGWTFESGTNSSTTPSIVAEIRASDGAAKFGGTVTAPTFSGALSGNASTATTASKLQTARTIAGVSFDGSENIAIPFANLANRPATLAGYGVLATDTMLTAKNASLITSTATTGITNTPTTNINTYLNIVQGGSVSSSTKITGSGIITVSSDINGAITIHGSEGITYLSGTKELILSGTDTTNRVWSGKTLKDWYLEEIDILLDSDRFTGSTFSSNVIDLTNVNGAFNVNSVNNYTTYTLSNKKVRGAWARVLVNSSMPITITGVKLISLGSDFELNTNMYLNIMYDGINTLGYYTKVAGVITPSYYISTSSTAIVFNSTSTPISNFCNRYSDVYINGVRTFTSVIKDICFAGDYSNITSIDDYFLSQFNALISLDLSSMTNITSFGYDFLYPSNLQTLKMGAIVPPTLGGTLPATLTSILVPSAAVNAYKAAHYWIDKASIISGY